MAFARDVQSGIGSSDAPELVGVGFTGPGKVWYSKFCDPEEIARIPLDGRLRRGMMLEHMVAEEYVNLTGVELRKAQRVRHPQREWQRASPDYERVTDLVNVELKAIDFFDGDWGPMLSDRLPDKYRVQCQHQMGVMGKQSIHLCATAVLTWETRIYHIGFDQNIFDWLTAVETEFWEKYVVTKTPPPLGWEDKQKVGWKDRSSNPEKGIIQLGDDAVALCDRRMLLTGLAKECDKELDEIKEKLLDHIADYNLARAGKWLMVKRHTKATEKRRESYWVEVKEYKEVAA